MAAQPLSPHMGTGEKPQRSRLRREIALAPDLTNDDEAVALNKMHAPRICRGRGQMSADSITKKIRPCFWKRKESFCFIDSRLKNNYPPVDLNHQTKGERIEKAASSSVIKRFLFLLFSRKSVSASGQIMEADHTQAEKQNLKLRCLHGLKFADVI